MIEQEIQKRILVLDGAMGTMIQQYDLSEEDYCGERFKDFHTALKGNNDLLSITQPQIIQKIHEAYLETGADIIETNTFNSNAISMLDYDQADLVYELNYQSAKIAKQATNKFKTNDKPRYVAGSIGPTNKTASLSPRVENPAFREVSFIDLAAIYEEQTLALLEGGVDLLLVETVFDTLNAKACFFGIENAFEKIGEKVPLMVSGTITDASGRTLSSQTTEAFLISLEHVNLLSIGLNCALGAEALTPYVKTLAEKSKFYTSVHPNAGLPNAFGQYDETPQMMMNQIKRFLENGWLNIVGGCCGTTPEHIKAIAEEVQKYQPRNLSCYE